MRTVERQRLVKHLGVLDRPTQREILAALADLFAE
jgi:hypothetical protein